VSVVATKSGVGHRYTPFTRERDRYRGMEQTFAGVIYLHEITQARSQGTPLLLLKKWCATQRITNAVLATTKWNEVSTDDGKRRERQLDEEWKNTITEGRMCRLLDTPDSACDVRTLVLQRGVGKPLLNSSMKNGSAVEAKAKRESSGGPGSHSPSEKAGDRPPETETRDTESYSSARNSTTTTLANASSQRLVAGGTNGVASSGNSTSSINGSRRTKTGSMNGGTNPASRASDVKSTVGGRGWISRSLCCCF